MRFLSPRAGKVNNLNKRENMAKVLEKVIEKKEVVRRVDPSLQAIERLTVLNGTLVEQVQALSSELDDLKNRVSQVASRLGI